MDIAWFLILAPLAAAIAILLNLHRKHDMAIFASVGSTVVCFVIAVLVAIGWVHPPTPWTWISLPGSTTSSGLTIEIGMIFDPLSKGMLLIVTGVGMLIHFYSVGYMKDDPSKGRFFGGLSIFMFSMTGIVLASNLIELFIFWEGVGLSSYLLIGFWYQKESAAVAANKAFVCNRIADFGFMLGILTYWFYFGTVSVETDAYTHLGVLSHNVPPVLLGAMVFGLFCGCIGKSAMVPLHVWLPDAMEGPTPVSALIHAATMVAAGVYMLCRVYPLLLLSPDFGLPLIATVGCFTAIFAALIAVQQNDIKRILAYTTLSQLGYMVMAVGCGGPDAAMFHLSTHAFFKALLFLAAGSVIHALHDEQDIWKMGGLWNKIPLTFWVFAIGTVALMGVPPLSGSVSKDYVLTVAYLYHPAYYWVGVVTAGLTAFYMSRLVIVAFFGRPRTDAAKHPHESPPIMTVPLIILAILSVVGGYIDIQTYYHGWMISFLQDSQVLATDGRLVPIPEIDLFLGEIVPLVIVLLGAGASFALYWGRDTDPLDIKVLANKFYIDELYDRGLVDGVQKLFSNALAWFDSWIVEGLIIRGGAYLFAGVGEVLRLFQTGSLQTYAFLFSLGSVILIYFTLFAH